MTSKSSKRALTKNMKRAISTKLSTQLNYSESSSQPEATTSSNWLNRQRVLVLGSRGISADVRHLLRDLGALLVHSRRDCKLDRRDSLSTLADLCELHHCTKVWIMDADIDACLLFKSASCTF